MLQVWKRWRERRRFRQETLSNIRWLIDGLDGDRTARLLRIYPRTIVAITDDFRDGKSSEESALGVAAIIIGDLFEHMPTQERHEVLGDIRNIATQSRPGAVAPARTQAAALVVGMHTRATHWVDAGRVRQESAAVALDIVMGGLRGESFDERRANGIMRAFHAAMAGRQHTPEL